MRRIEILTIELTVILKRLLEKILKLHNGIAEINKKWDLESDKNINVKGAKHRSSEEYLLWLREECNSIEENMDGLKKQITFLNKEIRKAEIKRRTLTK